MSNNFNLFESLLNSAGNIIAGISVALGLATLTTINNVSHEVVRLQEQMASIKSELSDVRGDFGKDLRIHEEQIKQIEKRLDQLEKSRIQVQPFDKDQQQLTHVNFVRAVQHSCRVCREGHGCRTTTCSDPT